MTAKAMSGKIPEVLGSPYWEGAPHWIGDLLLLALSPHVTRVSDPAACSKMYPHLQQPFDATVCVAESLSTWSDFYFTIVVVVVVVVIMAACRVVNDTFEKCWQYKYRYSL